MACGARLGIRTPNLLIRSEMLYPIELRMHYSPKLQGLGTTLERGANIIIVGEFSNEIQKKRIPTFCVKLQHHFMKKISLPILAFALLSANALPFQ